MNSKLLNKRIVLILGILFSVCIISHQDLSSVQKNYVEPTENNDVPQISSFSNVTIVSDAVIYANSYWNNDSSTNPAIEVDGNNITHVVWMDNTDGVWGSDYEIMYANYTTQTGWSNATVISDGFSGSYWNDDSSTLAAIAIDGNNTIHVVWQDNTNGAWGSDGEIMYVNYSAQSGWSNATVISDGFQGSYWNDGTSEAPEIAIDGNNNLHVVWMDETDGIWGTDKEIMYVNYSAQSGWSNATVVSDGYQGSYWNDDSSNRAVIAVDGYNIIHVIWDDYSDGPWGTDIEILYANYSDQTGWSNATAISDGFQGSYWNDGTSLNPACYLDGDNILHVVWDDNTDGIWGVDQEIMYVNYSAQTGWSNVTILSDGYAGSYWNDGNSVDPNIILGSNNEIHVVWADQTDGAWGTDTETMYLNYSSQNGWSNATVISDGYEGSYWNDGSTQNPAIAPYGNNGLLVVWTDGVDGVWGSDVEILGAGYSASVGWSNVSAVSDGGYEGFINDGGSTAPSIAIDGNNVTHIVWEDYTVGVWGTDKEIMYASYSVQTGWSKSTVISDGYQGSYWNDGDSYDPAIVIDGNNTIHVIWMDTTDGLWGTDSEIMYVDYTVSTGWSNATVISDDYTLWNNGASGDPAIAVDKNNIIHAVWEDGSDGAWGIDEDIMYANFSAQSGWSNATVISDDYTLWNNGWSYDPKITIDRNESIHVVWFEDTNGVWGTDTEIMHVNYTASTDWSNATVISDGYAGSYWNDGDSFGSVISVDENNQIHVVWYDDTDGLWGTDTEIMYVKYTTQTGWSNATVISDGYTGTYWNDGHSDKPVIKIDGNNVIHVVWEDSTSGVWGTDYEIMYLNYTTQTGWSNTTVISDGFAGSYWNDEGSYNPDMFIDGNNTIHVVWQDNTNGAWGSDGEIMHMKFSAEVIDTDNGGDSPNPPPNETEPPQEEPDMFIIILIVIIGSVIGISVGAVITVKKKSPKPEREEDTIRGKEVSQEFDFSDMPGKIIAPPKPLKAAPKAAAAIAGLKSKGAKAPSSSAAAGMDLTQAEQKELEQTASEIDIEEKEVICVVHKGPIVGALYLCPKCKTYYCVNCALAIKEKGEKCWACENEIDLAVPKKEIPEVQQKINKLEERIASLKNTIKNLDDNYTDGDIDEDDYNVMRRPLIGKIANLKKELEDLRG